MAFVLGFGAVLAAQPKPDVRGQTVAIYKAQMAKANHDCQAESEKGQQPYNVCLGAASEQLDGDYKTFFRNVRQLVPDNVLPRLDEAEQHWVRYREKLCVAAHQQFEGGTMAPAAAASCDLAVTRGHMHELFDTFDLGSER